MSLFQILRQRFKQGGHLQICQELYQKFRINAFSGGRGRFRLPARFIGSLTSLFSRFFSENNRVYLLFRFFLRIRRA